MSSPMMNRMLGLLPFLPFGSSFSSSWTAAEMNCCRSALLQQSPFSWPARAGAAARDHGADTWPDAASHPPSAPTRSATGTARFLTRNMTFLLVETGRRRDGPNDAGHVSSAPGPPGVTERLGKPGLRPRLAATLRSARG